MCEIERRNRSFGARTPGPGLSTVPLEIRQDPVVFEACSVCRRGPMHRLGCPVLTRVTGVAAVFFAVVTAVLDGSAPVNQFSGGRLTNVPRSPAPQTGTLGMHARFVLDWVDTVTSRGSRGLPTRDEPRQASHHER